MEKLEKNQMLNQKNAVIIIQFIDYYFHNYSSDEIRKYELYKKIKPIVDKCFEKTETINKHILGVIIYEEMLNSGIFFKNKTIDPKQKQISALQLLLK